MGDQTVSDDDPTEKGYLLAQVEITDPERYREEYATTAIETVRSHGGTIVAASADPTVLEGEWEGNWTAIFEFPSVAAVEEWYHDEAYQEVVPARESHTQFGTLVVFPEFSVGDLGSL